MSRNIRKKYPQTPVKAVKRRGSDATTSSLRLSDDDAGYSGVEDVSDSDDEDEEHVNAAEERYIITKASRKRSSPRPPAFDDDDADEEADDDDDDVVEEDEDFTESSSKESGSWEGILSEDDSTATEQLSNHSHEQEPAVERHVRFTGVPDSDSDSTTTEASDNHEDFFPDIFVDQNSLDPGFKRQLDIEGDDSSTSGSFWDFNTGEMFGDAAQSDSEAADSEDTATPTPMPDNVVREVSTPTPTGEVQELDGYETDGETTEEDEPQPVVRRKQMQRFPHAEQSPDSEMEKATPFRRGKPRVGRFNLGHSDKPVAVMDPETRKMMIFTPQGKRRLDLSPESLNMDVPTGNLDISPLLTASGYLMMGAMFSSNALEGFADTPFGPTEAFFPLTSDPPMDEFSSGSDFLQEDEDEAALRLEDFVTFHNDSSNEEEGGDSGPEWDGNLDLLDSSPSRPRTATSGASATTDCSTGVVYPLLHHFDNNSDAVGAFRRNQYNQRLISSDKATQDSLAFSGPLHIGTLRGIKPGSLEAVATPITPTRRHKRSHTLGGPSLRADMQGSSSHKRRASTQLTDHLHKRQRSISDMDLLKT